MMATLTSGKRRAPMSKKLFKRPIPDDPLAKRMEAWDRNLPDAQRNPNAKEWFDEAVARAVQPEQAAQEKAPRPDGYSDEQTR